MTTTGSEVNYRVTTNTASGRCDDMQDITYIHPLRPYKGRKDISSWISSFVSLVCVFYLNRLTTKNNTNIKYQ